MSIIYINIENIGINLTIGIGKEMSDIGTGAISTGKK